MRAVRFLALVALLGSFLFGVAACSSSGPSESAKAYKLKNAAACVSFYAFEDTLETTKSPKVLQQYIKAAYRAGSQAGDSRLRYQSLLLHDATNNAKVYAAANAMLKLCHEDLPALK